MVDFCNWCPDPRHPSPACHPGGQARHDPAVQVVEAVGEALPRTGRPTLFLAGGITGCPDWQSEVIGHLSALSRVPLAAFNPRRRDFPIHDPEAAPAQIRWEFRKLREADAVLFWFPAESVCPIALYELGAWSMADKPLFVGCHPAYPRRLDVEIQTRLARPEVVLAESLTALAMQAAHWAHAEVQDSQPKE